MTDKAPSPKNMIQTLLNAHSQFTVIGLTGRTGSGCTTAAGSLEDISSGHPPAEDIRYDGKPFFSESEIRKYEVASRYVAKNNCQFTKIKVSNLISVYILNTEKSDLINFINEAYRNYKSKSHDSKDEVAGDDIINEEVLKGKNGYVETTKKIREDEDLKAIKNTLLQHGNPFNPDIKGARVDDLKGCTDKFTENFKEKLNKIQNGLYIIVYQAAGNSIREIGKIHVDFFKKKDNSDESTDFDSPPIFHLPETINRLIKLIQKNEQKHIIIDAIRNPYEVEYLKSNCPRFYLISINAPKDDRTFYLQNVHKYGPVEIKNLDETESGEKIGETIKHFTTQNIQRCLEISDIHIFNPKKEQENHNVLKAQLIWYVALMLHPGLITPSPMERVMHIAYATKLNSGCISRKVGAVITDRHYSVKSVGWNDVPAGQVPCNLRSLTGLKESFNEVIYSEYERTNSTFREEAREALKPVQEICDKQGLPTAYCFKCLQNEVDDEKNQVHTRSLHAEENAMLQLVKYGSPGIEGGILFSTASPCELCSKKAYQLGIRDVIYIDPYPGIASTHIMSIGNRKPALVQFRGAVGSGYHRLYEPMFDYKDELEVLKNKGKGSQKHRADR